MCFVNSFAARSSLNHNWTLNVDALTGEYTSGESTYPIVTLIREVEQMLLQLSPFSLKKLTDRSLCLLELRSRNDRSKAIAVPYQASVQVRYFGFRQGLKMREDGSG